MSAGVCHRPQRHMGKRIERKRRAPSRGQKNVIVSPCLGRVRVGDCVIVGYFDAPPDLGIVVRISKPSFSDIPATYETLLYQRMPRRGRKTPPARGWAGYRWAGIYDADRSQIIRNYGEWLPETMIGMTDTDTLGNEFVRVKK